MQTSIPDFTSLLLPSQLFCKSNALKPHYDKVASCTPVCLLYPKIHFKGIFLTLYYKTISHLLHHNWHFVISGFIIREVSVYTTDYLAYALHDFISSFFFLLMLSRVYMTLVRFTFPTTVFPFLKVLPTIFYWTVHCMVSSIFRG